MTLIESFFDKINKIKQNEELKKRIVYTLLWFLVARIGTYIPSPGVNVDRLGEMTATNDILAYINMFSGGGFQRVSIFALGIIPYINASIVFSLLGSIIPRIEEIQKEGESGRARITQWTRYLTIGIAIVQSIGTCVFLIRAGLVDMPGLNFYLTTVVTLTAGTIFLMWVGEQISINGIGNGVSLLIFLNCISGGPANIAQTITKFQGSRFLIPILAAIGLAGFLVVMGIVVFQMGERKIPIHYVGKGYGRAGSVGEKSYIPLKLNSAGVMPVIFASVAMIVPTTVVRVLPASFPHRAMISQMFSNGQPVYLICFALIIIFFSFFYTALIFDPEKVADNLRQSGGTIPSIRPGTETVEYLEGVLSRITWGGAFFLVAIAILPTVIFTALDLPIFFGGTSILIVVGVAIDTVEQINARLATDGRNYRKLIR